MNLKDAMKELRARHKAENPDCSYGDEPHFVPPSFGQVGFYLCSPPSDLTNHSRCRPPYDHESDAHSLFAASPSTDGSPE